MPPPLGFTRAVKNLTKCNRPGVLVFPNRTYRIRCATKHLQDVATKGFTGVMQQPRTLQIGEGKCSQSCSEMFLSLKLSLKTVVWLTKVRLTHQATHGAKKKQRMGDITTAPAPITQANTSLWSLLQTPSIRPCVREAGCIVEPGCRFFVPEPRASSEPEPTEAVIVGAGHQAPCYPHQKWRQDHHQPHCPFFLREQGLSIRIRGGVTHATQTQLFSRNQDALVVGRKSKANSLRGRSTLPFILSTSIKIGNGSLSKTCAICITAEQQALRARRSVAIDTAQAWRQKLTVSRKVKPAAIL